MSTVFVQTIWMYTCFVHVAIDDRRKDYYVMYIHHCVTMALIILSFTGTINQLHAQLTECLSADGDDKTFLCRLLASRGLLGDVCPRRV